MTGFYLKYTWSHLVVIDKRPISRDKGYSDCMLAHILNKIVLYRLFVRLSKIANHGDNGQYVSMAEYLLQQDCIRGV